MIELTIIMPVFNGEEYIEEAIKSILAQSFTDFELVIINDNSTDGTQKIIDGFVSQDARVSIIKNPSNYGPAKSRNLAIDQTDTEFIAFMDADDKAVSTRFEKQIDFLKNHPYIGVCGTWATFFGDKNKILSHHVTHDEIKVGFLSHCAMLNPTVMLRREVLGDLRFPEHMIVAEDYALFSQLIAKTKFHNIPEPLLYYRWHKKNISKTKTENLREHEYSIRAGQLKNLGINPEDPRMENYVNAISLKRNEPEESIKITLGCAKELKILNRELLYFDPDLFERHIDTTMVRTIRNAKSYSSSFYKFIKNESGYFSKIPKMDAALLFLKSYLQ